MGVEVGVGSKDWEKAPLRGGTTLALPCPGCSSACPLISLPLSARAQPAQSYLPPQPAWDSFSQPDLHFY